MKRARGTHHLLSVGVPAQRLIAAVVSIEQAHVEADRSAGVLGVPSLGLLPDPEEVLGPVVDLCRCVAGSRTAVVTHALSGDGKWQDETTASTTRKWPRGQLPSASA